MLTPYELILMTVISLMLIAGGYQFYFLPQRKPLRNISVGNVTFLDRKIPFRPQWVWIYSFAYYPYLLSPILTITDIKEFFSICISYLLMLFLHIFISYCYPVRTPAEWRSYKSENSISRIFLMRIQKIDKGGNCFPSMHVAVAVLTTLHLISNLGENYGFIVYLFWVIPILISFSALYTKQHFVADIAPGFALALTVFWIYTDYITPIIMNSYFVDHVIYVIGVENY